MYDLSGKVAMVTGTAKMKGLGRHIALRLAQEGANLIVSDLSCEALGGLDPWEKAAGWRGLQSLVTEIRSMGQRALAIPADLSRSAEIDALVATALGEFGRINILVNNAAMIAKSIGPDCPLADLSEEVWRKTIDVNLTGVFLVTKAVARGMIDQNQGGKIVNISSILGKQAGKGKGAYSAAKFGVIGLTQAFAAELALHRITVNAVCPGQMVSWGTRGQAIYEGVKQGLSESEAVTRAYDDVPTPVPLGRPGTVEEIANLVLFLASSQSDYITGQALNINGGWLMSP